MSIVINQKLDKIKKSYFNSEFELIKFDLFAIEDFFSTAIQRMDFGVIEQISKGLEDTFYLEDYRDTQSYLLGKINTIIELSSDLLIPNVLNELLENMSVREKSVLTTIDREVECTPTEITDKLFLTKQHTSNILSILRKKGLVHVKNLGKNRYYSLTPLGSLINNKYHKENGGEVEHNKLDSHYRKLYQELIKYKGEVKTNDYDVFPKKKRMTSPKYKMRGISANERRREVALFNPY